MITEDLFIYLRNYLEVHSLISERERERDHRGFIYLPEELFRSSFTDFCLGFLFNSIENFFKVQWMNF